MEFERAIYRVYERSIEGLLQEEDETREEPYPIYSKSCRLFEIAMLLCAITTLAILTLLHPSYVGKPGCLPAALTYFNSSTNQSEIYQFYRDEIVGINIDSRVSYQSSIRSAFGDNDDNGNRGGSTSTEVADALVVAPVKLDMNLDSIQSMFRKRYQQQYSYLYHSYSLLENLFLPATSKPTSTYQASANQAGKSSYYPAMTGFHLMHNNTNSSDSNNSNQTSSEGGGQGWQDNLDYDYLITFNEGVTLLPLSIIQSHHFKIINLTLGYSYAASAASSCFGSAGLVSLLEITAGGMDIAVLNQLTSTINLPGYMINTRLNDYYHWKEKDLLSLSKSTGSSNSLQWYDYIAIVLNFFVNKLSILLTSLWAFFLLSTTTALLVRVLISSGVIIIFPICSCCSSLGLLPTINLRIFALSYPWIGLPIQLIRTRQQSTTPFIIGHLTRVVIYYLLYIAAQSIYIRWLYGDSPGFGEEQLWLYAIMMLWEYYSMIYLRSSSSIYLFPRASLAIFLLYHFYFYCYPTGFHLVALWWMAFSLCYLMTYCVRKFEVKAFRQGLVSLDTPRMIFNVLPWPAWRAELAPDYTMFMPVTNRSSTVYQDTVPVRPGDAPALPPGAAGAGGGGAAGGAAGGVLGTAAIINNSNSNSGTATAGAPNHSNNNTNNQTSGSSNSNRSAGGGYVELQSLFTSILPGAASCSSTTPANFAPLPDDLQPLVGATTIAVGVGRSNSSDSSQSFFANFFPPSPPTNNYQSIRTTEDYHHLERDDSLATGGAGSSSATTAAAMGGLNRQEMKQPDFLV